MDRHQALERQARALLLEEADALDERRWDDWLALWEPDGEFHAPAWEDDDELTSDPRREISLIYCGSRERLAERVARVRSGLSSSLARLPRTCHLVTNVRLREVSDEALVVTANFHCDCFKHEERRADAFFGRYRYRLRRRGEGLTIARKLVVVYNDAIPRLMDFFNI